MSTHCFLLPDVNILWKSGAMTGARISSERSATGLLRQLQYNPVLSYLHKNSHLLITFAEDVTV
jgi:hypothetical protein